MTTKKSSTSTKKAPAKKPAAKSVAQTAKKTEQRRNNRTGIITVLVALCAIEAISIPFFIHAFVKNEPANSALETPATGDVEVVTDYSSNNSSNEEDAAVKTDEVEAAATSSPAPGEKTSTPVKQTAPVVTTPKKTTSKPSTTKPATKKPVAEENTDEAYLEHENRPSYDVEETPADSSDTETEPETTE